MTVLAVVFSTIALAIVALLDSLIRRPVLFFVALLDRVALLPTYALVFITKQHVQILVEAGVGADEYAPVFAPYHHALARAEGRIEDVVPWPWTKLEATPVPVPVPADGAVEIDFKITGACVTCGAPICADGRYALAPERFGDEETRDADR